MLSLINRTRLNHWLSTVQVNKGIVRKRTLYQKLNEYVLFRERLLDELREERIDVKNFNIDFSKSISETIKIEDQLGIRSEEMKRYGIID